MCISRLTTFQKSTWMWTDKKRGITLEILTSANIHTNNSVTCIGQSIAFLFHAFHYILRDSGRENPKRETTSRYSFETNINAWFAGAIMLCRWIYFVIKHWTDKFLPRNATRSGCVRSVSSCIGFFRYLQNSLLNSIGTSTDWAWLMSTRFLSIARTEAHRITHDQSSKTLWINQIIRDRLRRSRTVIGCSYLLSVEMIVAKKIFSCNDCATAIQITAELISCN